jgi:hypothetical protein
MVFKFFFKPLIAFVLGQLFMPHVASRLYS